MGKYCKPTKAMIQTKGIRTDNCAVRRNKVTGTRVGNSDVIIVYMHLKCRLRAKKANVTPWQALMPQYCSTKHDTEKSTRSILYAYATYQILPVTNNNLW